MLSMSCIRSPNVTYRCEVNLDPLAILYALKTDIVLLPILKKTPTPTTQESVVRSSSNVKVKGGTRKKVIAKCLILTRDKAL